jgi:hypothetical protein
MQLQCQEHPEEPLDMVCLSAGCEQRGLVCFLCELEHHKGHDSILPLRPFINAFLQSTAAQHSFLKEIAKIDKEFISIQENLTKAKRLCLNYPIIEEAFCKFWKATAQEINNYGSIVKELEAIIAGRQHSVVRDINNWIEKHSGLYQMDKEAGESEDIYANFLNRQLDKLHGINLSLEKVIAKPHFEDAELLTLLEV